MHQAMRFTWGEPKRKRNLKNHDLDFADAERVFKDPTFTCEADRFRYEEQRCVTRGLFKGIPLVYRPHGNQGPHAHHLLPKGDEP